jgi:hypothetical protein
VSVSALTGDNVEELFMKAAALELGFALEHSEKRQERKT